ncbi:MAG: hypothetical protein K5849_00720 [Bacteroidales bacterium]|nr:hypothetical protein [Bacteroidales bacterium]
MKPGRIWAYAAAFILGWMLPACSEPDGMEEFVSRKDARDGVYLFTLPLTDTTAAYDFWFYSRVGKTPVNNVRLNVQWLAPSGDGFSETVYMRSVGVRGTKELYRSGMVPAQAGDWQLSVRPVDVGPDFLGMGIVYKKQDGTR